MKEFKYISDRLLEWYHSNKRDLPWRNTRDPYKIWVSEIILQQTRVAQGTDYYLRFISRFPDIRTLAEADEREVLIYWQGLGYYSRARNLHYAARVMAECFGGEFPRDYQAIRSLKGVGDYTAAAVASFAFDLPYAAVDGNVFRVLSRLFGDDCPVDTSAGKRHFSSLAQQLLDFDNPALFNQSMMEFGALQCISPAPLCSTCPLQDLCLAFQAGNTTGFPVKSGKTKQQELYFYYFHIHFQDTLYLRKREGKGIWQNLYEFPLIESESPLDFQKLTRTTRFRELFGEGPLSTFRTKVKGKKHILSHRILHVDFYEVTIEEETPLLKSFCRIRPEEAGNYPVHRLMESYLSHDFFG